HVVMMHLSDPVPPPSTINPALTPAVDAVITRVMAKDPADRYTSGVDFQRTLAAALGIEEMGEPMYQPRFLATTWTHVMDAENDLTYASATHLLDDFHDMKRDYVDDDAWTDAKGDAFNDVTDHEHSQR
ncbi:MAG TPA: hypothetical protein VJZ27_03925, partial [Aggregatilineales bacterium]|nr:hypothetical protein [Aggregatilineales bacterium]